MMGFVNPDPGMDSDPALVQGCVSGISSGLDPVLDKNHQFSGQTWRFLLKQPSKGSTGDMYEGSRLCIRHLFWFGSGSSHGY